MKKLLILVSVFLVTSISYAQSAREERILAEACKSLPQEDCEEKARELAATGFIRAEDDGWKLEDVLKQMTKRYPASVWSKVSKCNRDAEQINLQISRLVRGSDEWIDQVDKLYLEYNKCLTKAQPKQDIGDGGKFDPDKETAF